MGRLAIVLFLLLTACGGVAPSNEPQDVTGTFNERLDAGAPCQELFDIRNTADPKDPDIKRMNNQLRAIGCYSSSSDRTDG